MTVKPLRPTRPLRFGMRVQVTAQGHFYEGLYATLIGAAVHEPFYQLCLDVAPDQEAWADGSCLTPLSPGDEGYDAPDPLPEVHIELED